MCADAAKLIRITHGNTYASQGVYRSVGDKSLLMMHKVRIACGQRCTHHCACTAAHCDHPSSHAHRIDSRAELSDV